MFIRFNDFANDQEVIIRLEHVSRIDVQYAKKTGSTYWLLDLPLQDYEALSAVRIYRLHLGGKVFTIPADAPRNIVDVVEELYRDALACPLSSEPLGGRRSEG